MIYAPCSFLANSYLSAIICISVIQTCPEKDISSIFLHAKSQLVALSTRRASRDVTGGRSEWVDVAEGGKKEVTIGMFLALFMYSFDSFQILAKICDSLLYYVEKLWWDFCRKFCFFLLYMSYYVRSGSDRHPSSNWGGNKICSRTFQLLGNPLRYRKMKTHTKICGGFYMIWSQLNIACTWDYFRITILDRDVFEEVKIFVVEFPHRII